MFMLNAFCWLGDVISYMDLNCPGIGCSLVAMVRYMWQMVYSQRFTRTNLGSRTLIRPVWHDIRWYPQSICGLEPMVLVRSIRNFGIMEVFTKTMSKNVVFGYIFFLQLCRTMSNETYTAYTPPICSETKLI